MNANDVNNIDFQKILLAVAMAALFFFQGMSQVQHTTTKETQKEHGNEIKEIITKEAILEMIVTEINKAKQ